MKVILLNDIAKLGKRYDVKDVSSGHAINFLIPRNLAIAATTEVLKRMEKMRAAALGERKVQQELLVKNLEGLDGITITIQEKANEKGHLFGGLHREEIAREVLKQTRLTIEPSAILLEHPIKEIGTHTIEVAAAGKSAAFKLVIETK